MRGLIAGAAALLVLGTALPALADLFPRVSTAAGSVIARKSGEEVQFVDVAGWKFVDVNQDLLAGDTLKTNASGHLAVLFSDRTQVRLGRNTTMVVKSIGGGADTELALEAGVIWARAERGGDELTIETPAAAAAIRGTDWTMTVDGDGRTSLIVLEGVVELANAQGSVTVTRGEAAVAAIGQAPTKTVIVDPDDREQMLYYLSLRTAYTFMPASPLSSPDMRAERARIEAVPPAARGAEDWVALAEVSLNYIGKDAAKAAAAEARAFRLTRKQQARLDLLDALLAGAEGRHADSARLFAAAAPALDTRRRAIALYGGYFARSLADPGLVEKPPVLRDGGPYAALAAAWTAGFLKDIPAAIAVIRDAEARYPNDPTLPAARAQLAILIDDREQVKEAVERALSLDPDDPMALEARATYRASIEGDLDGAHADLTRAVAIAPGSSSGWNALGLVEDSRGGTREAEAALKRSIALDPTDPVGHANLAMLYLDQDRIAEAKVEIDAAIAADPAFDIALVARGRYHLQNGDLDKAVQDLLAGTTANPAYSQGLLLLGAAHYERGDREAAEQAFDNAERLDPNDPAGAFVRTAVAISEYRSDEAIGNAQRALRLTRARGGHFSALSANRDAGSTLNDAFRLQGLNAWGRYYGDAVFDPFTASGYVDQAVAGSANPFGPAGDYATVQAEPGSGAASFSAFFQGLMLDPLMLSGRQRTANMVRRPFVEAEAGAGFTYAGDEWKPAVFGEVRSYSATPVPWSLYATGTFREAVDPRTINNPPLPIFAGSSLDTTYELINGTAYVTALPSPNDRLVTYLDVRSSDVLYDAQIPPGIIPPGAIFEALDGTKARSIDAATAWSHTFGYRNVANVAAFFTHIDQSQSRRRTLPDFAPPLGITNVRLDQEGSLSQQAYIVAANHLYGVGDVTLRYGVEGGLLDLSTEGRTTLSFPDFPQVPPIPLVEQQQDSEAWLARAYVDALYEVSPTLQVEAALFGTLIDGDISVSEFEPRLGVAWTPFEGHRLRAAYLRETKSVGSNTLAPIGMVGLQANQAPLGVGGVVETAALRWDAEWTDRFFTEVDYQHQGLERLSIDEPGAIDSIDIAAGRIDRVSLTGNFHIGAGLGAFATVAFAESENRDPASADFGGSLPFVPDLTARTGLTYVHPWNVKVTLAATYVGERDGGPGGAPLGDYWTADAFLTWEPFDKRFEVELAAYNLFDANFDVANGVPGWGPTVVGSVKVRF